MRRLHLPPRLVFPPRPPCRQDVVRLTNELTRLYTETRWFAYEQARRAAWNQFRAGDVRGAVETARKALNDG